jgi:hypothetical protein
LAANVTEPEFNPSWVGRTAVRAGVVGDNAYYNEGETLWLI